MISTQKITIIPTLYFAKILLIFRADVLYLCFRKADILRHISGIEHGILQKVVERRLRFIFFDRQDTGQIC